MSSPDPLHEPRYYLRPNRAFDKHGSFVIISWSVIDEITGIADVTFTSELDARDACDELNWHHSESFYANEQDTADDNL